MDGPLKDEAQAVAHVLASTGRANGDDAAVLRIGGGMLCISTDSTIMGVHAPPDTPAHAFGRRAAARAISDIAAMGGAPVAVTCAVHVPPEGWAEAAAAVDGARERAGEQGAQLVGGDFARVDAGALALVITVIGRRAGARREAFVPRHGLRAGDVLLVTGELGAAAAALRSGSMLLPEPPDRVRAGIALAPFASAMIDLSDGLARDAAHLAALSGVAIDIHLDELPVPGGTEADAQTAATGGDDYELLVGIRPDRVAAARAALWAACPGLPLTAIGVASDGAADLHFRSRHGRVPVGGGFVHE